MSAEERKSKANKMLLYLGIFSIVMLFAGLTSGYLVSLGGIFWVKISLPAAFYISTALILLSSLTFHFALKAAQNDSREKIKGYVLLTFILGLGFAVSQFVGWKQLTEKGNYVSGHADNIEGEYGVDYTINYKDQDLIFEDGAFYFPDDHAREKMLNNEIAAYSNTASSFIYILSFTHLVHLLGGILYLIFILVSAYRLKISATNYQKLKLGSIYWHFLDGLWLYLFLFLLFIH